MLLIMSSVEMMLGDIKSKIGFGYNPKNIKTIIMIINVVPSVNVTSAKGLSFVFPNITF